MNHQLWHYTDLATGEGKFIQAGNQRSASDKLKSLGIRFSGLKKYRARVEGGGREMKTFLLLIDAASGLYSSSVFAVIVRATDKAAAREAVKLQDEDFTVKSCDEYSGEIELRSTGEVIYG